MIESHHYYGLKEFIYTFNETTQEVNKKYPEFADIEKVSIISE